ncbi:MAG: type II toxin-antitoxin system RelE/ParE family toxin [Verrucomicrobiota bacterium]
MSYRLNARPEVSPDILEAADWYERQQPDLGADFVREVRHSIQSLRVNPLLYRIRHAKWRVRWVLLHRFPYQIVFVVDGELITILAVMHAKRHDRHWRERAKAG